MKSIRTVIRMVLYVECESFEEYEILNTDVNIFVSFNGIQHQNTLKNQSERASKREAQPQAFGSRWAMLDDVFTLKRQPTEECSNPRMLIFIK